MLVIRVLVVTRLPVVRMEVILVVTPFLLLILVLVTHFLAVILVVTPLFVGDTVYDQLTNGNSEEKKNSLKCKNLCNNVPFRAIRPYPLTC